IGTTPQITTGATLPTTTPRTTLTRTSTPTADSNTGTRRTGTRGKGTRGKGTTDTNIVDPNLVISQSRADCPAFVFLKTARLTAYLDLCEADRTRSAKPLTTAGAVSAPAELISP